MSLEDGLATLNRAALECGITTEEASEAFGKLAEVANEVAERPGFKEWREKVLKERFGKRKAKNQGIDD